MVSYSVFDGKFIYPFPVGTKVQYFDGGPRYWTAPIVEIIIDISTKKTDMINDKEIIILRKAAGTWYKGFYTPGTLSIIYAKANSQPLNGEELQKLEEGNRIKGTRKFYSEIEIIEGDIVRRSKENVAQVETCEVDVVIDSTDYTCTINGNEFLYNSGIGATTLSIVAGLVAAIQSGSELITIIDNLDGTYTITSSVKGTLFTIEVDGNQSINHDVENVTVEYEIMQAKDWHEHNIPHYKTYGLLIGK